MVNQDESSLKGLNGLIGLEVLDVSFNHLHDFYGV